MTSKKTQIFDIAIVGGGLAGLTMAASLKDLGAKIALIAPPLTFEDKRTTALLQPSMDFYKTLGLWDKIEPYGAPLKSMRLIDGSKRLLRAPTVEFHDHEMELSAFGHNVPNSALIALLNADIEAAKSIVRFDVPLENIVEADGKTHLSLEEGTKLNAKLVIAADGRHSKIRETIQIPTKSWQYPQHAMVVNFSHSRPHHFTSNEFHTETGPFTQVPLPNAKKQDAKLKWRSSLVWVVTPEQAEAYKAKSREALAKIIEEKMHSLMGALVLESDLQSFPLQGSIANSFAKDNVALIGETAHSFPPIGAQGFNLGVRDIKAIYDIFTQTPWQDIIASPQNHLAQYDRERQRDAKLRTQVIDLFNRSLLTSFLPVQAGRSLSLFALSKIPHLKKFVMKQSLGG